VRPRPLARRRRLAHAALALGVVVAGLAAIPAGHSVAHASGAPFAVFTGYGEGAPGSPNFPSPWSGSSNTIFYGGGSSPYDAAGVRIQNTSTSNVTIDSIEIDDGSHGYIFMPGVSASPGENVIWAQYDLSSYETCNYDSTLPGVKVQSGGVVYLYTDSNQILNSAGVNPDSCSGGDESQPWQTLTLNGTATPTPTPTPCGTCTPPPTPTDSVLPPTGDRNGSQLYGGGNNGESGGTPCAGDPVTCVNGNYWTTATDLSVPGRGRALSFARTYNALAAAAETAPDALGWGWTDSYAMSITFDAGGNATVHEENGSTIPFTLSGSTFTGPPMANSTLVHNADGTYTFTLSNQTTDVFDASGRLTGESDRNHYVTSLAYDGSGHLATVTDPAGRTLTLAYDGSGRLSTVSDPLGHTVTYGYDAAGNLSSVSDPMGNAETYTYDGSHRLLTATDAAGEVTTNTYDSASRVTRQVDPMGRATTFQYATGTTTITRPNGGTITETFDADGNVASRVETTGTVSLTTTYTYDSKDDQVTVTDPNGHTWKATYGTNGNRLTRTDPLGNTSSWTYDSANDITSATDANGVTTLYSYDANGNLASVSQPLTQTGQTAVTTFAHGDAAHPGDLTATTDPTSRTTQYTYDANGDVVGIVDGAGDRTTATFNAVGWLMTSVRPSGNVAGANPAAATTTYTHDGDGAVLSTRDGSGHVTSMTYDAVHRLLSTQDANGHLTQNAYDADGEQTLLTRADGSTQQTTYDADGNVATESDGMQNVTSFGYDLLDRPTSVTDPLNRVTRYSYDGNGNNTAIAAANQQTTSMTYDAANRLVGVSYSDGRTPAASFGYDADGHRTSMSDGTGTTTYTYDSLGRLTGNSGRSITGYGYDLAGRLTAIDYGALVTLNGPDVVTRVYDGAGRMVSVSDWLGHNSNFTWDVDGNLTGITYGNGTTAAMSYDTLDHLTSITDTGPLGTFLSLPYTSDASGMVTSANPLNVTPAVTQTYGYDAVNRLVSAQVPTTVTTVPNRSYAYDGADRLTTAGVAGAASTTYTYDAASELTSQSAGLPAGGTVTNTYDVRGNRTSSTDSLGNVVRFAYDQGNRLTDYTGPALNALNTQTGENLTLQYTYYGDGLRATWGTSGVGVAYGYDLAEGLPLVIDDTTAKYVTGPGGLPLEMITPANTVYYYHSDRLGSTRALTDANGRPVVTYTYDPFGKVTPSSTQVANPILFAGQYTDPSGLVWLRARYYDPTTAQFITRDPLSAMTRQPYVYAGDNPLNNVDPSGYCDIGWLFINNTCAAQGLIWLLSNTPIGQWAKSTADRLDQAVTGCDVAALATLGALGATCATLGGMAALDFHLIAVLGGAESPEDLKNDLARDLPGVGFDQAAAIASHLGSEYAATALETAGDAYNVTMDATAANQSGVAVQVRGGSSPLWLVNGVYMDEAMLQQMAAAQGVPDTGGHSRCQ